MSTVTLPRQTERVASAIEVFARGFCFTRSFTHPYLAEKVEGLWVLRDAERRRGDYRREEWLAHQTPAAKVDRIARRHTRGRFAICAIAGCDEDQAAVRDAYRGLGYHLSTTEPLMVHDLARIPRNTSPATIQRVLNPTLAEAVNRTDGNRQILPEHLTASAPLRLYAALVDESVVGWVRSIDAGGATWCSNMYVLPAHRRRGIGRALLAHMLRDDRKAQAAQSVLLASHTGAKLYESAGYAQIGTLLLYNPKRR